MLSLNILSHLFISVCVCVCVTRVCCDLYVKIGRQLCFFFCYVGPLNQIQVIKHDSRYLTLPDPLASL